MALKQAPKLHTDVKCPRPITILNQLALRPDAKFDSNSASSDEVTSSDEVASKAPYDLSPHFLQLLCACCTIWKRTAGMHPPDDIA